MNVACFFCLIFVFFSKVHVVQASEFRAVSVEIINKVTSERSEVELSIGKETIFENILIYAKKCAFNIDNNTSYVFMEVSFTNEKKIFSGWLSSDSISLNSVQNSIYDINVISNCYK